MTIEKNEGMIQGNIPIQLLKFALPIFVGELFQNLYNSVDSLVVGNFVGKVALAAVNAGSPITMLLTGFFVGMSTGASVLFSQCFGARQYDKLKRAIHTTVLLGTILGLAMAVLGIVFNRQLLSIVDCPEEAFEDASRYLSVYIAGLLFTSIYNIEAGVLRAVGDSRSPFYALVAASILNILLDLLFVYFFQMGVLGVAVATIISQLVSVLLTLWKMTRMDERYAFRFRELSLDRELIGQVIRLGLPAGVQMSLISISNMFVARYTNSFGTAATAGVGAANRLDRFVSMPSQALGLTATTFVSQNVGAERPERISRGFWWCCAMAVISLTAVGLPMYICADFFVGLFNKDPEVVTYGALMMRIVIPFYFLMAASQILAGLIRGYGYSLQVMLLSLVGMVGIRQLYLAVAMGIRYRIETVLVSYPIGWGSQVALMIVFYFVMKKLGKLALNGQISQAEKIGG